MGRRRRWKSQGLEAPRNTTDADPVTRTIAVHGSKVAIAAGRRWRVVDIREQAEVHTNNTAHEGAVRGIQFSSDGQYMLTCGDDKTARTWNTAVWSCLRVLKSAKKASACAFSADGRHLFFADRFGDVLTATTTPAAADAADAAAAAAEEPALLLGHLQAIITSLTTTSCSSGQQLLVSTDRDGKVRSSVLPQDPTKGSYEIQSYCLGHTSFVTCSAAVPAPAAAAAAAGDANGGSSGSSKHLVVSGSGDGTVRLWDVDTGKQLACYVASDKPKQDQQQQQQQQQQKEQQAEEQQQQQQQGEAEGQADDGDGDGDSSESDDDAGDNTEGQDGAGDESQGGEGQGSKPWKPAEREQCSAVLSIAVSPDGSTVAAAVEGQQEVQLLKLDAAAGSLELLQKLVLEDVANPAAVAFDGEGRLWIVGGVLLLETESAHVGVAAREGGIFQAVTPQVLPPGLRSYLECRVESEEEAGQAQAQANYYHEGFKRKVYTQEQLSERKRVRTDHREAERLRVLQAAEDKKQQQQQQQAADTPAEQ